MGDPNDATGRFVRRVAGCLVALLVVATDLQGAGTGPHRWRITGNVGSCGSLTVSVENDFASFAAARSAMLASLAAANCSYAQPTDQGTFPQITVYPDASASGQTAFGVGAFCKAHVEYPVLPSGGCNASATNNPDKGSGCAGCKQGNPVDVGNANKSLEHLDYAGVGPFALRFARTFNSISVRGPAVGPRWTHSYERRIVFEALAPGGALKREVLYLGDIPVAVIQ